MFADMEIKYPANLPYFILAIAAVVFFILAFRKKEKIMASLHVDIKIRFKAARSALLLAGLGLIAFSLLGPQVFTGYAESAKTGMDIYVLMDTSKSMLVSDIAPDRITVAKKIVDHFLDHLEGDRVGFIPFASGAYIQMPLTDDYQLARMFLQVIDTDMISGGGTNLAEAIKLANGSFDRTGSADRVMIILSDGEENDGASEQALRGIQDDQLRVFTIGVGTERGGLIPIYNRAGDAVTDYMKDEDGNHVTSRLNAEALMRLAEGGSGAYYQATLQGAETASLLSALSGLRRGVLSVERVRRFQLLYQYFLGAGIFLTALAWFWPERRMPA